MTDTKHAFGPPCKVKFGGPLGTTPGLVAVVVPATLHVSTDGRKTVVHAVVEITPAVYRALAVCGLGSKFPMATATVVLAGWEAPAGVSEYRVARDQTATIWCKVAKRRDAARIAKGIS